MKKFYLLFTLLLVAFVSRAEIVVDNLTATDLGLPGSYGIVEGKSFTSGTVYSAVGMTNGNYIQIKSDKITAAGKSHYPGVFNTTSVGNARKVEVTWNSGTTSGRVLQIYGKATPFVSTSAYSSTSQGGTLIGSITYGKTTSLDITGDYPYIAAVSQKSAQYIESLKITWETAGVATTCATPTFSVEEGTFYGDAGETKEVSLSCTTPNSIIKYTVNNGEEKTYNGTNIPELVYPGTYEVVAWAIAEGHDNSATATATYKLVDIATLTKFTKVTDASVLKAGDKVIFVNEKAAKAMSTNQKTNNRGTTTCTIIEGAILENSEIQVVTLEDAGTTGSVKCFAFNVGNGYLFSPSSSSNYLKTQTNNKDNGNGIWTISVDEKGNASIISKGTNNIIQYNTSDLFSSYPQNKLQQSVQLYYSPAPAATTCAAPKFFEAEGTYYGFNEQTKEITLSCSTDGATIMYSTDGENYNAYEASITITCPSTTKISAYAMMEDGSLADSQLIEKTYNYVTYPTVANIAEFKTQGAADATKPYMFTCPLTVTYQNGTRLYLRDSAGDAILVYGDIDKAYTAGNQLPANSVVGTYKVYNQMVEIIPVEGVEWPTTETIVDASPVEMTIDQLNAVSAEQWSTIASKLVVIKGAKVSADGSTITVGDALSFANGYAKRLNPTLENASAVYDVVGIIETHWNTTDKTVDGIQFCQTAYLDNYSPAKLYMIGYIQRHNQDWNATQGIVMEKEAAGIYSADVNLSFNDWFAITSRIAENNDNGGWAYINADRYAYTSGVFGKMATDYVMSKGDIKTQVFWTGNFKVTVNYPANTISFVPAAVDAQGEPDYATVFPEKLRIVGEIADGKWAGQSVVENHLATREANGYTYTFNELQFVDADATDNISGNFRFTTAWDATNWNTVNSFAIKAATAKEPKINFGVTANILPFTSNDLVADVQNYIGDGQIFANLQLIVNLKDMTVTGMKYSGVSQIKVGGATVTATNGTIRVDGGNTTSIYNIAGQAIALGSKAKEFSVASGMYIVNVDGKATKVVVR